MRKYLIPALVPALAVTGVMATAPAPARADDAATKAIIGVAQSLLNQELDKAAYLEAQKANTVSAYRDYLARFPKGIYVGNAQQALAKLGAPVTAPKPATTPAATPAAGAGPAQTEAAIGLTRNQRVQIQRQLTLLGYDTRGADGLWGRTTRGALSRWQTANRQTATGYITAPQVRLIAQQAAAPVAAKPATATPAAPDAALEESLLSLSGAEKREIQLRLTLLGYDTRGTDGSFGPNTRRALARWQGDHGERATGYLTADQVAMLKSESRG